VKIKYISHMGDDTTVVNSARVSFDKQVEKIEEGDEKLIKYLATHGHWTPFSHPQITMRETVPIFVARQRFKHMVGFTYNEISRRYVDSAPELYHPEEWRKKPEGSIKQGSAGVHEKDFKIALEYTKMMDNVLGLYKDLINMGVAPEQARIVLPQSMYTSYYVTGSLSAWARMYNQRIEHSAQREIQVLAHNIGEIIEPLYPLSWKALTT
jgi:thymidylate synthase (FAD)